MHFNYTLCFYKLIINMAVTRDDERGQCAPGAVVGSTKMTNYYLYTGRFLPHGGRADPRLIRAPGDSDPGLIPITSIYVSSVRRYFTNVMFSKARSSS